MPEMDLLTWGESIITLERQLDALLSLLHGGCKNYGGQSTFDVLVQTAKAIAADTLSAEEQHGTNEWFAKKRRKAEAILEGLGHR